MECQYYCKSLSLLIVIIFTDRRNVQFPYYGLTINTPYYCIYSKQHASALKSLYLRQKAYIRIKKNASTLKNTSVSKKHIYSKKHILASKKSTFLCAFLWFYISLSIELCFTWNKLEWFYIMQITKQSIYANYCKP